MSNSASSSVDQILLSSPEISRLSAKLGSLEQKILPLLSRMRDQNRGRILSAGLMGTFLGPVHRVKRDTASIEIQSDPLALR